MIARLLPLVGTGGLISVVALLGIEAAEVVQREAALLPPPSQVENIPAATTPPRVAQPVRRPAVYYAAITERPLFEPSRRPLATEAEAPKPEPVVEAPKPAEPEAPPPDMVLLGVISGSGRSAALIGVNSGESAWISEGEPIAGWTLETIGSDWIEITRDTRKIRVDLYK